MVSVLKSNQPQQNQNTQQGSAQDLKVKESSSVVHQERAQAQSPDAARLRALLSVKTSEEVSRRQQPATEAGRDRKRNDPARHKDHKHDKEHKIGGETLAEERQDAIAFKYIGTAQVAQQNQIRNRRDPRAAANAEIGDELAPGVASTKLEGAELVMSSQSSDNTLTNSYSSEHSNHTEHEEQQSHHAIGEELSHGPDQEVVKLLDLVGPEASLNFVERLREVWVMLDEGALNDLDVTARMPANMLGQSGAELLAVESPQGIHFVSFLANSNDF